MMILGRIPCTGHQDPDPHPDTSPQSSTHARLIFLNENYHEISKENKEKKTSLFIPFLLIQIILLENIFVGFNVSSSSWTRRPGCSCISSSSSIHQ